MQPGWPGALILPDTALGSMGGSGYITPSDPGPILSSGQTDYQSWADVIPSLDPISNDKSWTGSPRLNFNAGNFYDQYFLLSTMDILTGTW